MRTKMSLAEIGALMDNFSAEMEDNYELKMEMSESPDCSEIIKVFNEHREHDWELTANKISILGMLVVNACRDLHNGKIIDSFVSDRVELVLNSMLLSPEIWHKVQVEIGQDLGIFPEEDIKKDFEKKFGEITWDKMIDGEIVKPDGEFGESWKD